MATDNSTLPIEEKLTPKELSDLRAIRRAGMAIKSISEILEEHHSNAASVPVDSGVFIRLNVQHEADLQYAIEACANRITDMFDNSFDFIGLEDDFNADLERECQRRRELLADVNSFEADLQYANAFSKTCEVGTS